MTIVNISNRRFYEYDPDANSYAGVGFAVGSPDNDSDDDAKVTNLHWIDTPLQGKWKTLTCFAFDDNPDAIGDFPSVSNYRRIPMMSNRAWSALRPIIANTCESLPVNHPFIGEFYLVHVLRTIDALDESASDVERRSNDDPRMRRVLRYAFRHERIEGIHIFKLPDKQGGGVIVDDRFRKVVEETGLRGLRFKELPLIHNT